MLNFLFKQTDRNPAPSLRPIETVPSAQVPIAESTSSSPLILDIFSSPLPPFWESNNMPALEPIKSARGPSQPTPKYVEIRSPEPKHRYLFVGNGAAVGGKEKSG